MTLTAFRDGHRDLVYALVCELHQWAGMASYDPVNAEQGQSCPMCNIAQDMEPGRARFAALPTRRRHLWTLRPRPATLRHPSPERNQS